MVQTRHIEKHFESSLVVRDVVIGMADGLTVPFALAAGLSGAVDASHVIIIAGLAEVAAGSIAMGLGGYLAAKGDTEHYASERKREEVEIVERTDDERHEVIEILESKSRIEFIPYTEAYAPGFDDMRRRKPRVQKLEDIVRYHPTKSLIEIIKSIAA